jgi:hypothetical protein
MARVLRITTLFVLGACTSFGPAVTDTNGDGGTAAATPPSSATDAGSSTNDAFAPNGECLVTFCERFNDPPWARWTDRNEYDLTNPMTLDTTFVVSAPSSLRVDVQPRPVWHPTFLERPVPSSSRIILTASIRVDRVGSLDGEIDVLVLEMSGNHFASVVVKNDGTINLESESPEKQVYPLGGGVLKAAFEKMVLDLDFEAGLVRLTRDGGTYVEKPFTALKKVGGVLRVGAPFANNTQGRFVVNVDDLTLDARPIP